MSKEKVELTEKQQQILEKTIQERSQHQQEVNKLLQKEEEIVALIADMNDVDKYEGAEYENGRLKFSE